MSLVTCPQNVQVAAGNCQILALSFSVFWSAAARVGEARIQILLWVMLQPPSQHWRFTPVLWTMPELLVNIKQPSVRHTKPCTASSNWPMVPSPFTTCSICCSAAITLLDDMKKMYLLKSEKIQETFEPRNLFFRLLCTQWSLWCSQGLEPSNSRMSWNFFLQKNKTISLDLKILKLSKNSCFGSIKKRIFKKHPKRWIWIDST